jgi:Ribonuclease G/E
MNKELFVSATPHETKVGITEDDQLAEIYLERENEYTLAGSIYKGRVTRVLPGMQSAFVDIGLERDAFLYVSDFMDLEQQDEDLDEAIPANRPVTEARTRPGLELGGPAINSDGQLAEAGSIAGEGEEPEAASSAAPGSAAGVSRDFRGRRRRRGRRGETGDRGGRGASADRGEIRSEPRSEIRSETASEPRIEPRNDRFNRGERPGRSGSDSRFQRPAPAARAGRDYDYGPPPGYQPILLPGESISKYQRQGQSRNQSQNEGPVLGAENTAPAGRPAPIIPTSITANFPEDEPMFAAQVAEPLHEQHEHVPHAEVYEEVHGSVSSAAPEISEVGSEARTEPETYSAPQTTVHQREADFVAAPQTTHDITHGAVEEQEIEEEEADLTSYGEEPGDDEGFEEIEEETRAAGGELSGSGVGEIAPGLAAGVEPVANGEAVPEAVLEAEEREAEELELEEAQAEAEALLEAEAIGEGTVDASAEVRGPAPEARLLQRTQRRGPERGSDRTSDRTSDIDRRRGRRGGRRFRSRENQVVPQISELLKEGQEVLIQIAKEPIG